MLHQIDVAKPAKIICECYEVLEPSSGCCAHWFTYIRMYESQQVTRPFTNTGERRLGHLA